MWRVGWLGCAGWMLEGALQKLVLVVTSVDTKETLERWTFDIQSEDQAAEGRCGTVLSHLRHFSCLSAFAAPRKKLLAVV
jgi:hypothetical protein